MTPQDAAQQPLFTGPLPVSMGDRGGPVRPGQALLFSNEEGDLTELPRKPTAFGSLRYRYRYEVDLSDHTVSWSEPLQSGTGGFDFQAAFEARWKVSGPAEVVRRGIRSVRDGQEAVCVAVRDLLWPHATRYGIERMEEFAGFVRGSLCSRQHRLATGLTVDSLTVRIYLDEAAAGQLRALKQREFDKQLAVAGHDVAMTEHSLDQRLQTKRREALLAAARGEGGLLVELIAQDPSKLHEIMRELGQRHDVAVEQKGRMLRDLVEAGHIQPAEAQQMWYEMYSPAPLFGGGPTALPATGPGGPPAQLTQGPGALPAGAASAGPGGGTTGGAPGGVTAGTPGGVTVGGAGGVTGGVTVGGAAGPAVVAGTVVPAAGTQEPPKPRRRAGSPVSPAAAGPAAPVPPTPPNPSAPANPSAPLAPSAPAVPPASRNPDASGDGSANVVGETRVGPRGGRGGRRTPGAGS
ncbi:hypothetical protein [Streptomyces sp. NPDC003247]|uniref:hypothetical protein n=1 Tax=Streptomyces sp. NPDC003247 TaxID=3364677 RepID=UPI0036771E0C